MLITSLVTCFLYFNKSHVIFFLLEMGLYELHFFDTLYFRGLQPAAREGYFTKYNALWILKLESLDHGRARVAHCVTGRWRNVSHYCSTTSDLCVLSTEKHCSVRRQHTVYANSARGKYIVRHWSSRETSLRHSSGWGNLKRFPSVSWFAHPCSRHYMTKGK